MHVALSRFYPVGFVCFFFFNDTATTEIYTLSLHDALPISTRELFATNFVIDAICIPSSQEKGEKERNQQLSEAVDCDFDECEKLLNMVSPELLPLYRGARAAKASRNPDRARHMLTSLRELWSHLLRRVAPEEEVLCWINESGQSKNNLCEGKPTRRARVLYVCRNINNGSFSNFVVEDTKTFVKLIKFCNRVHELELDMTDEQLIALQMRSDSLLIYILRISLS